MGPVGNWLAGAALGVLTLLFAVFIETIDMFFGLEGINNFDTSHDYGSDGVNSLKFFTTTFAGVENVKSAVMLVAGIIIMGIFIFQLMKTFLGPISKAERPTVLFGRLALTLAGTAGAYGISEFLIGLGAIPYKLVSEAINKSALTDFLTSLADGIVNTDSIRETLTSTNSAGSKIVASVGSFVMGIFSPLMNIILFIMLFFAFFKLLFEIIERYLILGILWLFSPLCIATAVSSNTDNIFKSWLRVMCSQILLMMFNAFFLGELRASLAKLTVTAISDTGISAFFPAGISSEFLVTLKIMVLVSWARLGTSMDRHLQSLGVTSLQAGDGLAMDFRNAMSAAKGLAGRAGAVASRAGAAAKGSSKGPGILKSALGVTPGGQSGGSAGAPAGGPAGGQGGPGGISQTGGPSTPAPKSAQNVANSAGLKLSQLKQDSNHPGAKTGSILNADGKKVGDCSQSYMNAEDALKGQADTATFAKCNPDGSVDPDAHTISTNNPEFAAALAESGEYTDISDATNPDGDALDYSDYMSGADNDNAIANETNEGDALAAENDNTPVAETDNGNAFADEADNGTALAAGADGFGDSVSDYSVGGEDDPTAVYDANDEPVGTISDSDVELNDGFDASNYGLSATPASANLATGEVFDGNGDLIDGVSVGPGGALTTDNGSVIGHAGAANIVDADNNPVAAPGGGTLQYSPNGDVVSSKAPNAPLVSAPNAASHVGSMVSAKGPNGKAVALGSVSSSLDGNGNNFVTGADGKQTGLSVTSSGDVVSSNTGASAASYEKGADGAWHSSAGNGASALHEATGDNSVDANGNTKLLDSNNNETGFSVGKGGQICSTATGAALTEENPASQFTRNNDGSYSAPDGTRISPMVQTNDRGQAKLFAGNTDTNCAVNNRGAVVGPDNKPLVRSGKYDSHNNEILNTSGGTNSGISRTSDGSYVSSSTGKAIGRNPVTDSHRNIRMVNKNGTPSQFSMTPDGAGFVDSKTGKAPQARVSTASVSGNNQSRSNTFMAGLPVNVSGLSNRYAVDRASENKGFFAIVDTRTGRPAVVNIKGVLHSIIADQDNGQLRYVPVPKDSSNQNTQPQTPKKRPGNNLKKKK